MAKFIQGISSLALCVALFAIGCTVFGFFVSKDDGGVAPSKEEIAATPAPTVAPSAPTQSDDIKIDRDAQLRADAREQLAPQLAACVVNATQTAIGQGIRSRAQIKDFTHRCAGGYLQLKLMDQASAYDITERMTDEEIDRIENRNMN